MAPPVACSVGEMHIPSLFFCELSSRHLRVFAHWTARMFGLCNVERAASSLTPQMFGGFSRKCYLVRVYGSTGIRYLT